MAIFDYLKEIGNILDITIDENEVLLGTIHMQLLSLIYPSQVDLHWYTTKQAWDCPNMALRNYVVLGQSISGPIKDEIKPLLDCAKQGDLDSCYQILSIIYHHYKDHTSNTRTLDKPIIQYYSPNEKTFKPMVKWLLHHCEPTALAILLNSNDIPMEIITKLCSCVYYNHLILNTPLEKSPNSCDFLDILQQHGTLNIQQSMMDSIKSMTVEINPFYESIHINIISAIIEENLPVNLNQIVEHLDTIPGFDSKDSFPIDLEDALITWITILANIENENEISDDLVEALYDAHLVLMLLKVYYPSELGDFESISSAPSIKKWQVVIEVLGKIGIFCPLDGAEALQLGERKWIHSGNARYLFIEILVQILNDIIQKDLKVQELKPNLLLMGESNETLITNEEAGMNNNESDLKLIETDSSDRNSLENTDLKANSTEMIQNTQIDKFQQSLNSPETKENETKVIDSMEKKSVHKFNIDDNADRVLDTIETLIIESKKTTEDKLEQENISNLTLDPLSDFDHVQETITADGDSETPYNTSHNNMENIEDQQDSESILENFISGYMVEKEQYSQFESQTSLENSSNCKITLPFSNTESNTAKPKSQIEEDNNYTATKSSIHRPSFPKRNVNFQTTLENQTQSTAEESLIESKPKTISFVSTAPQRNTKTRRLPTPFRKNRPNLRTADSGIDVASHSSSKSAFELLEKELEQFAAKMEKESEQRMFSNGNQKEVEYAEFISSPKDLKVEVSKDSVKKYSTQSNVIENLNQVDENGGVSSEKTKQIDTITVNNSMLALLFDEEDVSRIADDKDENNVTESEESDVDAETLQIIETIRKSRELQEQRMELDEKTSDPGSSRMGNFDKNNTEVIQELINDECVEDVESSILDLYETAPSQVNISRPHTGLQFYPIDDGKSSRSMTPHKSTTQKSEATWKRAQNELKKKPSTPKPKQSAGDLEAKRKERADEHKKMIQEKNITKSIAKKPTSSPKKISNYPLITKNNKVIIRNALMHVCLAGTLNKPLKEDVLSVLKINKELKASKSNHFIILLRDVNNFSFRGLYVWDSELDQTLKLYSGSSGPTEVDPRAVLVFYKYDSGARTFKPIPTKSFGRSVDAISIGREYFVPAQ